MSKTDTDIHTFIPASKVNANTVGELIVWMNANCPEAMLIPFNREFMKAVMNEMAQGIPMETSYWVGFDQKDEAMLFKLTWA